MMKRQTPQLDEARWQMVMDRRTTPDTAFVYAVRTTGIYCVPTCPSRRPNRENVVFFNAGGEAQKASFRPCKRCQPDGNGGAE
jgi:AraC family transcriptional regulator of adaptative response/methylated-DNA-[protein]-cysteine methyltransferase